MMQTTDNRYFVEFAGLTDTGRRRQENEDNFHCCYLWDDRHVLAMVVDGVGGYAGGEVAARLAVEQTVAYLEQYRDGERTRLVAEALVHANNHIFRMKASEDRLYGMCCVMTVVLFDLDAGCIHMAHAGDTRLYAFCEGRVIKLSHDHSTVGRNEEAGLLSELEAMHHPYRNMLDRAVGERIVRSDDTLVETNVFPMAAGITWMLCSDGLCDMITSAEMASILCLSGSGAEHAAELVDAANAAGGRDNITVVLVTATQGPENDAMQVMDDYARIVLPSNSKDNDVDEVDSVGGYEMLSAEEPVVSEDIVADNAEPEPVVPMAIETQTPSENPGDRKMPRRIFPWKPFVYFIITVLLAVLIGWCYSVWTSGKILNDADSPVMQPSSGRYDQLYYNIRGVDYDGQRFIRSLQRSQESGESQNK